jgi:hypothetical protein
MKPQAYEALQKAKALFRHPAEVLQDDIPEEVKAAFPDGIRKPRVVLLPPNAPKFDAQSMKQEHKQMQIQISEPTKQIDKYVEMSTTQACADCIKRGISKPALIAKETGKNINQIYTALWKLKQAKKKAKLDSKKAKEYQWNGKTTSKFVPPKSLEKAKPACVNTDFDHEPSDWDREPTPYEDRNYVVMRTREDYEEKIIALQDKIGMLLLEKQELNTIIKYLEGRNK